jgi:hypothetical protein
LRVNSVAVMASHGKVQPITSATTNPARNRPVPPRILSGVQPTGNTHLGNYIGAKQWAGHAAEAGA